jgi:hypothetical protein
MKSQRYVSTLAHRVSVWRIEWIEWIVRVG